jgi:hypothetical protein
MPLVTLRARRGTGAQWIAANPILGIAELGYETDTNKVKFGDGTTHWIDLPYVAGGTVAGDFVERASRVKHAPSLGLYFPEAEGAVGDGVTNDRAALNTTIATAGAAKGKVVLDGTKTYAFSGGDIVGAANVEIVGNGATLKALAAQTGRGLAFTNVGGWTVRDLTVDMNKAATTDGGTNTSQQGIYGTATGGQSRIIIERVTVKNCWHRGIALVASGATGAFTNVTINQCLTDATNERGIHVEGGTTVKSSDVHISRCLITNSLKAGIGVRSIKNVTVDNNTVVMSASATEAGIIYNPTSNPVLFGVAFSITRNRVTSGPTGIWGIQVLVNSTDFVVSGNIVDACGGGIQLDPDDNVGGELSVNGVVSNNRVTNSISTHGIHCDLLNGLTIVGNLSRANKGDGIAVFNSDGVTVTGNNTLDNHANGISFRGTIGGSGSVSGNFSDNNNLDASAGFGDYYVDPALPDAPFIDVLNSGGVPGTLQINGHALEDGDFNITFSEVGAPGIVVEASGAYPDRPAGTDPVIWAGPDVPTGGGTTAGGAGAVDDGTDFYWKTV